MLARVTPNTVSLAALNAPPDPSAGLWLDDHVALFEEKWQELERRFFKLETLQFYDESGVPAFEAWKRGDIEEVRRLAATEARVQAEDPVEQRTQSVRVRILGVPVSDYVRWENEIYRALATAGEVILGIEEARVPPKLVGQLSDFQLFDERCVFVSDYDDDGSYRGAWYVDDPTFVAAYARLADALIETAEPFEQLVERHF